MALLHVHFLSGYASRAGRQARAARTEGVLRSTPLAKGGIDCRRWRGVKVPPCYLCEARFALLAQIT